MELIDIGEKIIEKDIVSLEKLLDINIPQDYKDFLLKYNGGTPKDILVFSFIEVDPETKNSFDMGTDIQFFSNISELPIFYENLFYGNFIPEKYLSIACDSFGNEILLSSNLNDNYGKVFFGNHELIDPKTNYFNLTLVSNSFSEFLQILKKDEDTPN